MMKVPLLGHQREVAHEDRLALDLAGGVVDELRRDEQRGGVGHVLAPCTPRSEYLGGSKRWSRNDSDMVPEKSSIGEISSKISSRPDCRGRRCRPASSGLDAGLPALVAEQPVEATRSGGRGGRVPRGARGSCAKEIRRGAVIAAGDRRGVTRCARLPRGVLPRACGAGYARTPTRPGPTRGHDGTQRQAQSDSANWQCSQSTRLVSRARQVPRAAHGRMPSEQTRPLWRQACRATGPVHIAARRSGMRSAAATRRDGIRPTRLAAVDRRPARRRPSRPRRSRVADVTRPAGPPVMRARRSSQRPDAA